MSENRKTCFVIMPFSETTLEHTEKYWTDHYNNFLKPLIEENPELEAHRSEPLRGDILRQIITDLVVSPMVVADLTDKNANVFWELGVRQSFKHGTITIADEIYKDHLPFDVSGKGTLFYNPKNHIKMENFSEKFKQAIQDCLLHPDRPDSHVLETISGRGTLFEIFRRDEAMRRLDAVLSECDLNLSALSAFIDVSNKNEEKSKTIKGRLSIFNPHSSRQFPAARFSTIAIELLVTHRYLDENKVFYDLAENYLFLAKTTNGILENWVINSDHTEEWILRNKRRIWYVVENFKHAAEISRDKVSKLS